jgi:hypothetical protein
LNKFFKIIKWPVLILVLAFLYVRYTGTANDSHEHGEHEAKHDNTNSTKDFKAPHNAQSTHVGHQEIKRTPKEKEILKRIRSFSYEDETKRIKTMTNDYPQSREQIIDFVSEKDPYKDAKIEIKPHTIDSIKQNQIGALKVLALKTISLKEKNNFKRVKFYQDLLAQAKDPTIRKILKASINSAKQGRDFLKDFPDAINNGPADQEN